MAIGVGLCFFSGGLFGSLVPGEMFLGVQEQMRHATGCDKSFEAIKEVLTDKACALMIFSRDLGYLVAIMGGGALFDLIGYRDSCDIMTAFSAMIFVIDLVLVKYYSLEKQLRRSDQKVKDDFIRVPTYSEKNELIV